jgi:phosphatidate cytidylyltransferase
MVNWRQWDSHQKRWGTALLLAAPVLLVLTAGPYWSWLLVVVPLVGLGLWEFADMVFAKGLPPWWQAFYISAGLLLPMGAFLLGVDGLQGALFAAVFAAFFFTLSFAPQDAAGVSRIARLTLGWLYVSYLMSHVLLIGQTNGGNRWVFFALLVTIANDAGAFYSGRKFGRHKLYERVSPKKTIEGSVGGIIGAMAVGASFGYLFLGSIQVASLLVLSLVLAVTGQVGDLIESQIKRISGVKDSSNVLPGHGGVLDRLDSLLFVFPVVWFFVNWM